ncbi:MAG: hypothetical protein BJ554DRAFT_4342 [Olpidium bornovanus]|uniref:Uncharacterized protein n=1 Tax=Olpidium bornovanus TaxID=278681 RepID=A0A8H7ZMW5_9FUNG|nr:MAG: hypothetical protein BJ554DRAFT_4342 [Olpidium bornovanus]
MALSVNSTAFTMRRSQTLAGGGAGVGGIMGPAGGMMSGAAGSATLADGSAHAADVRSPLAPTDPEARYGGEDSELSELEVQSLYAWIDEVQLSRPKKNFTRDFSDGGGPAL